MPRKPSPFNYVYIVQTPQVHLIKVGIWSKTMFDLYSRYLYHYGKDTVVYAFETPHYDQIEKNFIEHFDDFSKMLAGELFDEHHFQKYYDYLVEKTVAQPTKMDKKYYDENDKSIEEKQLEYRNAHAITPEQTEINIQKRQDVLKKLDKIFLVTSPDVNIVYLGASTKDTLQIANTWSTYFGKNTQVFYIESKENIPDKKEKFKSKFQYAQNHWSIYDKYALKNMLPFLEQITQTHTMVDRKQIIWVKNTNPTPKNKSKNNKIEDVTRKEYPCQTSTYFDKYPNALKT